MQFGTEFASAAGAVNIFGTGLLPDQIIYQPSNLQLYCAREGQSSYTPFAPPCNGLFTDSNYIARRPVWQRPPSISENEWREGLNFVWRVPAERMQGENRYCFL